MCSLGKRQVWLLLAAGVILIGAPSAALAWNNYPSSGGGGGYSGWSSYQPYYYQPYYPVPFTSYAPTPVGTPYEAFYPPAAEEPVSFTLHVPAKAEVWFDGDKTLQTGAVRRFISPPLGPGRPYHYDIRVQWREHGQTVAQTRHVYVQPGDELDVSFGEVASAARAEAPRGR